MRGRGDATPPLTKRRNMEITKEFLEDRIKNFNAEIDRLGVLMNHTAGMRDACSALLEHLEKLPEGPKE
jgi:hypothetical protein